MAKVSRSNESEMKSPLDGTWSVPDGGFAKNDQHLNLTTFFPYRLSILNIAVSKAISQLYADRFNLSRHEWRVIAALGDEQTLSSTEVSKITSMDKMTVSRAVTRLTENGLIAVSKNNEDRRQKTLRLTKQGLAIYKQIVPMVHAREDYILSALTDEEYAELNRLMGKTYERAMELQRRG
jgi:DNA-binding MarR family transcriptional regulator